MGIHYDYKSTKSAKLMEKQAKRLQEGKLPFGIRNKVSFGIINSIFSPLNSRIQQIKLLVAQKICEK